MPDDLTLIERTTKGRASSIRPTLELFQRQHWGNFAGTDGAHMGFPERVGTILNWKELNKTRFKITLLSRPKNDTVAF